MPSLHQIMTSSIYVLMGLSLLAVSAANTYGFTRTFLNSNRGGQIEGLASSNTTKCSRRPPLYTSTCTLQGARPYQEDEILIEDEGRFVCVFDGHGGKQISRYLRLNLFASYQAALSIGSKEDLSTSKVQTAIKNALLRVDDEVCKIGQWSYTGSTAVVCIISLDSDGVRTIVTANVGDSRAVLCRNGVAVDLSRDHKPNDEDEMERIEKLGGSVDWCGDVDPVTDDPILHTGVYRVNSNLALSRAIGDKSERPFISNEADISTHVVKDGDSFIVLASDGLFDVMSSQEVVSFVTLNCEGSPDEEAATRVAKEALKRGSSDNITVIIIWL
mmetsp:Transcript_4138/g.9260  ORF Transcript_4138/g.9260 Transcript_4138/m.9260 type:complete len:330 (+) Transcript_4138:216-1205(+)